MIVSSFKKSEILSENDFNADNLQQIDDIETDSEQIHIDIESKKSDLDSNLSLFNSDNDE